MPNVNRRRQDEPYDSEPGDTEFFDVACVADTRERTKVLRATPKADAARQISATIEPPTGESGVTDSDVRLIEEALARRPAAARMLVRRLSPVIQKRVNGALIRRKSASRQDVLDLIQEVFRILFDEDGKILRSWEPERGATLEGFVSLVAERRVASVLASGRRSGHSEYPHAPETMEHLEHQTPSPEARVIDRQELAVLLNRLREEMTDQAYAIFRALVVEERDVPWVMDRFGLTRDAVYQRRARFGRLIQKIVKDANQISEARLESTTSGGEQCER